MMARSNQKGFTLVEGLLVVLIVSVIGGVCYYVYQSNKDNSKVDNKQAVAETSKVVEQPKVENRINPGWKLYESQAQKISFEYPENWTVEYEEDQSVTQGWRIYIKSPDKCVFKDPNNPTSCQNYWISTRADEVPRQFETETELKSGSPHGGAYGTTAVKASIVDANGLKIRVYEYKFDSVSPEELQAFWTDKNGKQFYARNGTDRGDQNAQVDTLRKILPTVKHL